MGSSWNHFAVPGQAHALRQPEFPDLLFDFRPHRSLATIQLRADGGGKLSAGRRVSWLGAIRAVIVRGN